MAAASASTATITGATTCSAATTAATYSAATITATTTGPANTTSGSACWLRLRRADVGDARRQCELWRHCGARFIQHYLILCKYYHTSRLRMRMK